MIKLVYSMSFDRRSVCSLSLTTVVPEEMITGRERLNVPPNTLIVISVTSFYGSNDPINSVKALKEDRVLRIGLKSHQAHRPCSQ